MEVLDYAGTELLAYITVVYRVANTGKDMTLKGFMLDGVVVYYGMVLEDF